MNILNLTQHPATPEQRQAGVVDLNKYMREVVSQWLTFKDIPTRDEIETRAGLLAGCAIGDSKRIGDIGRFDCAMIGGAPYLMAPLEKALRQQGVKPVYAFSRRVSTETVDPAGIVTKTSEFKHGGFIAA